MTIKSRRHINFYLLSFFIFGIFQFASLALFREAYNQGKDQSGFNPMLALASLFYILTTALTIYLIRHFMKLSPKITINDNNIYFKKEKYSLSDIKSINLSGKFVAKQGFGGYSLEGAEITFNDSTVKQFFNMYYGNIWLIKSYLEAVVIKNQSFKYPKKHTYKKTKLSFKEARYFKNNQLLSFRGISLWGVILWFSYMTMIKNNSYSAWKALLIISIIWIIGWSFTMYCIGISKKHLIIQNHNWFWYKMVIPLDSIKEIVFDTQAKQPHFIRIYDHNFREKKYIMLLH